MTESDVNSYQLSISVVSYPGQSSQSQSILTSTPEYTKKSQQNHSFLSVETLSQLDPLLDLLLLLLAFDVVHNLAEQLINHLLNRLTSLLLGCRHCILLVGLVFAQVETGDHIIEGILGFRSEDQSVDTVHDLAEGDGWGVVAIEDGVTDAALGVHVAVVDRCDEPHFRGLEGVIPWELGIEHEQSIFIGGFLGSQQQDLPEVDVAAGVDRDERMRVLGVALDLLCNAFQTATS